MIKMINNIDPQL